MKPAKLKPNDLVAIISPSNTIANRKDVLRKRVTTLSLPLDLEQ